MPLTPDELKRLVAGAHAAAGNQYVDRSDVAEVILARALADIPTAELRAVLNQTALEEHGPPNED